MNCPNCNQPLEDGAKFCTNCGAKIELQEEQPREQPVEATAGQQVEQTEETPAGQPKVQTEEQVGERSEPFMTPENTAYEEEKKTTNGFAIAGLICSLITPFCLIPLALGIIGLVFGIKKWNSSGNGLAIAVIVLSGLKLVIVPILAFVIAFIIAAMPPQPYPMFLL